MPDLPDEDRLLAVVPEGHPFAAREAVGFGEVLDEPLVGVLESGALSLLIEEEAQRLGRLLRPKRDGGQAHFYSVVSRDTLDADYAAHRQRFLAEQGYAYRITDADDLLGPTIGEGSAG